jgi:hypothetical protein
MQRLTHAELDAQLAEQLPARELMGRPPSGGKCGCGGGDWTNGSYNGNGNGNTGAALISAGNGNLNGNLNGSAVFIGGRPIF